MSLFGSVAVKQPPKGRRAYTDEPEAWMKEGAMVLFEGQVGVIQYRKSDLYQETATDFVPVDEGKVNTDRANDYFAIRKAYFELAIKEQEKQMEQPQLLLFQDIQLEEKQVQHNGAFSTRTTTRNLSCLTALAWKSLQ